MENASKALLIAAAVLIVILLIAFGMRILNSTGDTSGQAEDLSSSQQMQTFNAQFTGYLGSNRSGSMLRNLLVAVNNSNKRNTQHQVSVSGTDVTGSGTSHATGTDFADNKTYELKATYDTTGYITAISVQ